ncbi:MAG: FAD-binding oxidoreductase [Alphaproteobacteria bacterium]|nr:FAD-binding oxidoreductase [Alphaproteobacteria bacterium]
MPNAQFALNAKMEPYWWEGAPRPVLPEPKLPRRTDVVVVGCGYTGVSASLTLAREGREVVTFDAEHAGWGCSTRNGGQIHTKLRLGLGTLAKTHGKDRAVAMIKEVTNARNYVEDLIKREAIDCDWNVCGLFVGAHRPGDYDALAAERSVYKRECGIDADMVPRGEQRKEIGTDAYYGGLLVHKNASLDPGKFHAGMLDRAIKAGVKIAIHCPVTKVEKDGNEFVVTHARGTIRAKNVIMATNGYTNATGVSPELRRRVVPIGSYVMATEKLPADLMKRLMPKMRAIIETRQVVYYYRASPDGTRFVFGGRVAAGETDPTVSGPLLHTALSRIFPEVKDTKITHSWMGFVAYTFDSLPHIGTHDGIHYAMGYCGSGAHLAPYLGHKVALKVLGRTADAATAYDDLKFPTRPFYSGTPWFVGAAVRYYKFLDSLPSGSGRRQ